MAGPELEDWDGTIRSTILLIRLSVNPPKNAARITKCWAWSHPPVMEALAGSWIGIGRNPDWKASTSINPSTAPTAGQRKPVKIRPTTLLDGCPLPKDVSRTLIVPPAEPATRTAKKATVVRPSMAFSIAFTLPSGSIQARSQGLGPSPSPARPSHRLEEKLMVLARPSLCRQEVYRQETTKIVTVQT